jgi:DNA repair exonuclease SbcCD nuclease subunit
MKPFRFIHAADLHLDAQFRGLSVDSPELGEQLRKSTFSAFENLVELCLQAQVDFLLVAGDVYNQQDRSLRAQLRFRDGLARLSERGICVYVVHGNHDPLGTFARSIKWPENVYFFESDAPSFLTFAKEGQEAAIIHGASHLRSRETRNLASKFSREERDIFQIGLLHCNLTRNTGHEPYAPCAMNDLLKGGIDYWALGHVHEAGILAENPYIVYSGNIQGLDITETEPKGCYLAQVNSTGSVELSFHALDVVRWVELEIDIESLKSVDQLEEAICTRIEDIQKNEGQKALVCRIRVLGRGPLHEQIQDEQVQDDLLQLLRENFAAVEPFVWIKDIGLETAPNIDLQERRKHKDFLGEILSQAKDLRQMDNVQEFLNNEILRDLFGHRKMKKAWQSLSEQEIDELIRQAEILCVDLFAQDSDR